MESVIKDYIDYLKTERALSENSVFSYRSDLADYINFCKLKKIDFLKVNIRHLRQYLSDLKKRSFSSVTVARRFSALRGFYNFLLREEKTETNCIDLIVFSSIKRKIPKYLSENEMKSLLSIVQGKNEIEIRDRAILELWYAVGCRISELISLRIDSIDWEGLALILRGKGRKERIVPFGRVAFEWCNKYRDIRHEWLRKRGFDSEYFFITRRGKKFSRQGMWKMVKKYGRKALLNQRIFPHLIRHSFATHMLKGGADLRVVQELLGHRSISTTEIYTHIEPQNLKMMLHKYHPRG